MSSTYDSIMKGTQVQEARSRLRTVQENYGRQNAEIVGAGATGQGWDAPGFEMFKGPISDMQASMKYITDLAVARVVDKVEADMNRKPE